MVTPRGLEEVMGQYVSLSSLPCLCISHATEDSTPLEEERDVYIGKNFLWLHNNVIREGKMSHADNEKGGKRNNRRKYNYQNRKAFRALGEKEIPSTMEYWKRTSSNKKMEEKVKKKYLGRTKKKFSKPCRNLIKGINKLDNPS